MFFRLLLIFICISTVALCDERQPASEVTKDENQQLFKILPFKNQHSFEDAQRGKVASLPDTVIKSQDGRVIWNPEKYAFIKLEAEAPDSVNPSLWRQSQLVNISGLFKVVDRIYQVRNYDLSNMTIIEGDTGIIVVDPLISKETAKAALDLYYQHRPKKPVIAVIHSHSHVDHYGGVKGVVEEEEVHNQKVKIVAPAGFLQAAVSENVMAGNAMSRRASYMYGNLLPADPKGQVGSGLGTTTSAGTITLIPPTDLVEKTGQEMVIDGLTFQFLIAPDSEAPAEMHWYIKELKALTTAENSCHTLHNTYSLRGAKIRNPLLWSKYLNETLVKWGADTEVLYGMHHWPVWGKERVREHLSKQRDLYRYINDETLRLANKGYKMVEIAEMIQLPKKLATYWSDRGYYGTMNHNVKATYVLYLGWFDGNPATLHVHPPTVSSHKYVDYMGGADSTLDKAKKAYDEGDYRWVAEVVNHVVFSEPNNKRARELQAKALEQMGYQAESGPWRNFYLTGAKELREGVKKLPTVMTASPDTVRAMDLGLFFDYLAMRLRGPKAVDQKMALNFTFKDTGDQVFLELENGVLNHTLNYQVEKPDATITLNRSTLNAIVLGQKTFEDAMKDQSIQIQGNHQMLPTLVGLLDHFEFWFPIVTPHEGKDESTQLNREKSS